jgi:hypothetical protein
MVAFFNGFCCEIIAAEQVIFGLKIKGSLGTKNLPSSEISNDYTMKVVAITSPGVTIDNYQTFINAAGNSYAGRYAWGLSDSSDTQLINPNHYNNDIGFRCVGEVLP